MAGKTFQKQNISRACEIEKVYAGDMEEIVFDPEKQLTTIVVEKTNEVLKDNASVGMCMKNDEHHCSAIWFEPMFVGTSRQMKMPERSRDNLTSVTFDLFASMWDCRSVKIYPKQFRQIQTGFALRMGIQGLVAQNPNWYGRIVSTREQDTRGIFHGSTHYDPRQSDSTSSSLSSEIVTTIFNMGNEIYVINPNDLIGRLIISACHVPTCGIIHHHSPLSRQMNGKNINELH